MGASMSCVVATMTMSTSGDVTAARQSVSASAPGYAAASACARCASTIAADRQPAPASDCGALAADQAAADDGDIEGHAQSTC